MGFNLFWNSILIFMHMFFHDIIKIDELLVKAEVYEYKIASLVLKDFDPLWIVYMLEQFSSRSANFFA